MNQKPAFYRISSFVVLLFFRLENQKSLNKVCATRTREREREKERESAWHDRVRGGYIYTRFGRPTCITRIDDPGRYRMFQIHWISWFNRADKLWMLGIIGRVDWSRDSQGSPCLEGIPLDWDPIGGINKKQCASYFHRGAYPLCMYVCVCVCSGCSCDERLIALKRN